MREPILKLGGQTSGIVVEDGKDIWYEFYHHFSARGDGGGETSIHDQMKMVRVHEFSTIRLYVRI